MPVKNKKVKKVTNIEDAKVIIEVEQNEEDASKSESTQELEETKNVAMEADENEKEPTIEPILNTLDEAGEEDNSISWKKILLYTFIAAGAGALILLSFLYLFKNYEVNITKKTASKQIELPSNTPTPTIAEVNKEAYTIVVLNGSGVAGEAANVQKLLEDTGFKIGEIGNASNQDFADTEISATPKIDKAYLDELEKSLSKNWNVKVVKAPASQTDEVIVTVGSNKTTNPSPTP